MEVSRFGLVIDIDCDHCVEAEFAEVREIFSRESPLPQIRTYKAESTKSSLAAALASDIGQVESRSLTNDRVFDFAGAVDQHAQLPTELARESAEVSG